MEFRLLKLRKWINSSDTILIDRNLVAYETRGEYFGMNPNLGIDKENFDREKAATRQWWLIPICHRRHRYLYAFNLIRRELLVLESLFDHPFDDKRKIVDLYMEQLNEIRRRLVIEIATSIYNTHRIAVFQKSFDLPQRRNNPNREKKKEVKTPFIAPSTK
ncbi:hypothetical protein PIB30_029607 [Stylosanthes scabra]|uniref:Uncharacterized protein n=1 Tax=Stylosanthes scabra TaxID=79078 RepID=A0ABU6Z913_9FABA|nr:hypothetical protein [Stylosanthes scabra]